MNVYMLIGNIGSGKTTYIKNNLFGVVLSKDDLRYQIGRGEYLYLEEAETYIEESVRYLFLAHCQAKKGNIILDEPFMSRNEREFYIDSSKYLGYPIIGIVFPDYGEDWHVKRRMKKNHGDTPESKWREGYNIKKSTYIKPDLNEGFDRLIFVGDNEII